MGMNRRLHCFTSAIVLLTVTLFTRLQVFAAPPSAPSDLQVGGFPSGQIRVAWTDNAPDETLFQIERSTGDRTTYALLTTVPANTTVYTDTAVTLETTYWYRVRACNNDGCSTYSKDSYNVSFAADAAPNLDEQYMLFLINEARADPAAYGYPSYAPLPPVAYNALMNYAAHSHSQAILNSDFNIGHCYPDPPESQPDTVYRCPSERARDVGYNGGLSENLIAGGDGWEAVEGAHQAFMDSEGHRNNVLDSGAKEAGLGHTYNPDKGSTWHGQYTHTFCGWNPVDVPALPSGAVVPYWGRTTTAFAFLVNSYDEGGSGPTQAHVVVDGVAHAMTLRHGAFSNGSYAYTTTLLVGTHTYYFDFQYGSGEQARLPESGTFNGPDVEVGNAVLEVPSEYPTLANALAHARGEVVVQLAAGTFVEETPIGVPTPGIWVQGAGIDETIIQGDGAGHVLDVSVDAQIRDLTITGGGDGTDYFESGIWNTSGHVDVHNCRFTDNNVGIFTWCFQPDCDAVITVTNSLFDHNLRIAVDANEHAIHRLTNNTIVANGRGVALNNVGSRIENSLVIHNTYEGIIGSNAPMVQYNDVWGNGNNYSGITAGLGDIGIDPLFEDEGADDYRLQIGSPCLDAGNPTAEHNDRNGSRNDLGVYGGPHALPVVNTRVSAPAEADESVVVTWEGYAADGIVSYDIQYREGDGVWVDWLTQTTSTSAQFGPTIPVSVTVGTYSFRSRGHDSAGYVEDYPDEADATTLFGVHLHLPLVLRE
jgi:uncharacterized protein YkwD